MCWDQENPFKFALFAMDDKLFIVRGVFLEVFDALSEFFCIEEVNLRSICKILEGFLLGRYIQKKNICFQTSKHKDCILFDTENKNWSQKSCEIAASRFFKLLSLF